nr:hypothetical protein [Tanacetum cinerariifolium]
MVLEFTRMIIKADVPPNDPNVDAPAIVPAPVNPDHAPAQPVGLGDGFSPHWIGNNIPNKQNDVPPNDPNVDAPAIVPALVNPDHAPAQPEEPEDDDDIEMDDEAKVIDPYMDDGSNNPPPPNFEDEETPPTSPVIPDADDQEPPAEPSARLVSAPYPDDPYVVTRDAAIADAAIATFGIDDDDDDTAPIDSQPHDHRAEGPNVAPVARECTFADFMKCSPITFRGNEGVVGLIRWIEKTKMVFTVSKCTEANKVVFVAATFQDRALTWWNSQVATSGIEFVTRKTWAEMKVMMTEEFCHPEEVQRMEGELWNLRVKEMDISSYTTRFNELVILCPGMVPTERKKVEAYIRGLSENIKGEVTSSEPATLSKAVRMAHTLMEQKVKAKAKREANNKKRKWENF